MNKIIVKTKNLPYKEVEVNAVDELAKAICREGLNDDLVAVKKTEDGQEKVVLTTFGIYIDKIYDMNFRNELLKVLIPLQQQAEMGLM